MPRSVLHKDRLKSKQSVLTMLFRTKLLLDRYNMMEYTFFILFTIDKEERNEYKSESNHHQYEPSSSLCLYDMQSFF